MERLKAELLLLARDRGDNGTTEEHRWGIDNYLAALSRYFSKEGVLSFTADDLRGPYVEFIKTVILTKSLEEAAQSVILHFHTRIFQRDKAPDVDVSSKSVVDIFSRRP